MTPAYDLHLGDCLDVLAAMPAGSVDCVITDPPYGIDYQSARRTDSAKWRPKIAGDKRPFVWFLRDAARVLAGPGFLLCFCRWDVAEAFRLAIGWAGLRVAAQVVWDRVGHGMGDLKGRPSPRHDLIWFATKGRYQFPGRRPSSVYAVNRLSGHALEHPNEKPAPLLEALIADYSRPGDLILDPFMGVGTTGRAAVKLGRRFVGVELEPAYHAIALARLAAAE